MNSAVVRIELPFHLRTLAQVNGEVSVDVLPPVTLCSVLDALEARYPVLRGTVRDHVTQQRRAFLRFFACQEDLSHQAPDDLLPEAVAEGREPLLIIGAIAGGTGRPASAAPHTRKTTEPRKMTIGQIVRQRSSFDFSLQEESCRPASPLQPSPPKSKFSANKPKPFIASSASTPMA